MKRIFFIGSQGSGKSTQAKLLSQFLKIPVIATGDIFRSLAKKGDKLGKRVKQDLDEGKLVDDETTAQIVDERVRKPDCQKGFIMDGYPRTLDQIKLFDPGFDKVFYLKLSDEEATKRLLKRGREDDTPALIAERLKAYHKQTDPILDYYQNKGLLEVIGGKGAIKQIQRKIRESVNG